MKVFTFYFILIFFCGKNNYASSKDSLDPINQLNLTTSKSDSIKKMIDESYDFRFSAPEKGLKISILAHDLSLKLEDTLLMILSSNNKALLQKENGLNSLALGSVISSLDWAKKYKSDSLLAYTEFITGNVYLELGDLERSLLNYNNALSYYLAENDSSGLSYTYTGIGLVSYKSGNNSEALDYYLLSEKYGLYSEYLRKAGLWNNIGAIYMELEEYDRSKLYYEKALTVYEKQESHTKLCMVYYNLGELELFRENIDLSIEYYNKSLTIANEINSLADMMWAYEGLYLNAKFSNEYEKSLDYFEKYTSIKDSLSNVQNLKEVRELEGIYEQDQNLIKIKEQEVELYQNEINANAQNLNNFIFVTVILLVSFLLAIGILFYFRVRKKNALLESQKLTISKSLFEKEILLKEIHHRVKNNIQVISSLLNLQKNATDNEAVEYVISETQNRIQAIALVHQKLYRSKDIEGIDFEAYLTELIELQMDIFQNKKAPLDLTIDLPKGVQIKLDLAISLGLIISEIITNAFKYAFNETDKPKLIIRFFEQNLNQFTLNIRDNGPGVPEDYLSTQNESLGMELIEVLTEQINGELSYKFEDGASFYIKFAT